jgi:hypothetical protein
VGTPPGTTPWRLRPEDGAKDGVPTLPLPPGTCERRVLASGAASQPGV